MLARAVQKASSCGVISRAATNAAVRADREGGVLYLLFIICANPKPAVRNLAMKLARHAVQLSRASKR